MTRLFPVVQSASGKLGGSLGDQVSPVPRIAGAAKHGAAVQFNIVTGAWPRIPQSGQWPAGIDIFVDVTSRCMTDAAIAMPNCPASPRQMATSRTRARARVRR